MSVSNFYNKLYKENKLESLFGSAPKFVELLLKYRQSGKVLDVGSGQGRNSLFLAKKDFDVTALDISDEAIRQIKKEAASENLKIKTLLKDIQAFPFSVSYDVVLFYLVLHHLPTMTAQKIIETSKRGAPQGAIHVIAAFTSEGDFYMNKHQADRFYLDRGELKKLYKDWGILEWEEKESKAFQKNSNGSPMINVISYLIARKS